MTLDQRLSQAARQVADGVYPPEVDVDAVRARARSKRRTTSVAVAATVLAVIAVGASVLGGQGTSAPDPAPSPSPSPSHLEESSPDWKPDSMTPEVVVTTPGARLETVGVTPGDTDIRMSIWTIAGYRGMALTTDGYQSTTYASAPEGTQVVSSPRDGLFLLSDGSDHEWLVDVEGTVRRVTRVDTEFVPTDPRLWFQCVYGSWRSRWCSLDPDTATAHVSANQWGGSAVRPGLGAPPWGAHPEPRAASVTGRLEAWWYAEGVRQVHTVAVTDDGDYIKNTPPGQMAFWAPGSRSNTLDIHTSRNGGADWEVETRGAQGIGGPGVRVVTRSPGGALLTCTAGEDLVIWRAEASGGPFQKVYTAPAPDADLGTGIGTQGSLLYLNTGDTAVVSEDDGRTWTTIETWRTP
jgi:hypothetical protein